MSFRNLDANGDWRFGKGRNDYVSGNAEVALNVRTRLLSWYQDCFFARNEGIDWLNRLGSFGQRALLEADIQRIILQTENVTGIISFSSEVSGRSFSASYSITTNFSTVTDTVTMGNGLA